MTGDDAVRLRQEWEAWQRQRELEQEQRHAAETRQRDAYEAAAWQTRLLLTEKLSTLLDTLEPYVDGTMGEVTAAMSSVYAKAAHELAALYGLHRPLREPTPAVMKAEPPVAVDPVVEAARRVEATAAAKDEVLAQLEVVQRRMLPAS